MKTIVLTLALAGAMAAPSHAKSVSPMSSDAHVLASDSGMDRGRISEMPSVSSGYQRNDPWGHWGAYYGPMIH